MSVLYKVVDNKHTGKVMSTKPVVLERDASKKINVGGKLISRGFSLMVDVLFGEDSKVGRKF